MLRFKVFRDGVPASSFDISTAYLVGSDNVPIRGEFAFHDAEIRCRKRAGGPAALAVMWEIKNFGHVLIETTRLPERDHPYILNVELARGRVMRLMQKREEWGFFELPEAQTINERATDARDLLIEAFMNLDDPAKAANLADRCLSIVMPVSEGAAITHAEILLNRRIQTRSFARSVFGCRVDAANTSEGYRRLLMATSDFVQMPMSWRMIEPQEQQPTWAQIDEWLEFFRRAKLPVLGGPLVAFNETAVPDWLYIWEHDYETVRDLLYEHLDRVITRYGAHVSLWNVLSGLHVNAQFPFTFDQLIDLTRMAVGLVKKLAPAGRTLIELSQPWGEYYANNQRSIPPLLYAEMVVQSGINFDLFGVQLCFGVPRDGNWQRDLFQVSMLLDRFTALGKPLIISGLQVPSLAMVENETAGVWRKPWSDQIQAKWLEAITNVILSKPFVEALVWRDLVDGVPKSLPNGGLVTSDLQPKGAYKIWGSMRRAVMTVRQGKIALAAPSAPPRG